MDSIPQKQCMKCGGEYPATTEYFYRDKGRKDGLKSLCKGCAKIAKKRWYDANRDYAIEYSSQWVKDNYEHVLEQHRDWRKRNPDKCNEYNEDWKRNHRPVYLASRKRRYNAQAEIRRAETADWRKRNPDKVIVQFKVRQARKRSAEGNHSPSDIQLLLQDQDNRCAYCGISISLEIKGDVHIDHIQPLSRGGSNWPENLAATCSYCNLSKKDKTIAEWQVVRGW